MGVARGARLYAVGRRSAIVLGLRNVSLPMG
jgi:hypothetical protein